MGFALVEASGGYSAVAVHGPHCSGFFVHGHKALGVRELPWFGSEL